MTKLTLFLILCVGLGALGCSGGDSNPPEPELKGTPEQKTLETVPGDTGNRGQSRGDGG